MNHADGGVKRYGIFKFADDPPFEHEEPVMPDQETIRRYVVNLDTIIDGQPIGLASVVLASDYALLEQQVEQLQGELQHWKDCYNGAEKARSEEQAVHSQRMHQMEHRAEQAEGMLATMTEQYQRMLAFYDKHVGTPCEQIRHQQEVDELQAHLATATARVLKQVAEDLRKEAFSADGRHNRDMLRLAQVYEAQATAAEPKEQGCITKKP